MLRRVVFVYLVVLFEKDPEVQWAAYFYMAILSFFFVAFLKPFETAALNYFNLFCELIILILAACLICMTQIGFDTNTRHFMGWIVIALFSLLALGSVLFIFAEKIAVIKNKICKKQERKNK